MEEGYGSQEQDFAAAAAASGGGGGEGGAVAMEGAEDDEMLRGSDVLSRFEVVKRRNRRAKQLMKLYRAQYWSLIEELRSKYRRFCLRTGKSGWREESDQQQEDESSSAAAAAMRREPHAPPPERSAAEPVKCGFQGCLSKPLPLSAYCFAHVLLDPKQCLYQACTYVLRSSQGGTCGKPVLKALEPSFCPLHFRLAQKQAARVINKTSNNAANAAAAAFSGGKGVPKLHVLVSEYVRAIQIKRRAAAA